MKYSYFYDILFLSKVSNIKREVSCNQIPPIQRRKCVMTKKENIKDEILIKMKYHLGTNEIAILESVLNKTLYDVNIVDSFKCLPSIIDTTNQRILELYELKRSMTLKESTMKEYMITAKEFVRYVEKPLTQITSEDIEYYLMMKWKEPLSNTSLNNKRRI